MSKGAATLFHVSRAEGEITRFSPFSHFGTYQAAVDRGRSSVCRDAEALRIYEVSISARSPLKMRDLSGGSAPAVHSAVKLADELFYGRARVLDADERARVFHAGYPDASNTTPSGWSEAAALGELAAILAAKGYDCIVYKNAYEDPGSLSLIAIDPGIVEIVSVSDFRPDGVAEEDAPGVGPAP
jgi:hypothetical protein